MDTQFKVKLIIMYYWLYSAWESVDEGRRGGEP